MDNFLYFTLSFLLVWFFILYLKGNNKLRTRVAHVYWSSLNFIFFIYIIINPFTEQISWVFAVIGILMSLGHLAWAYRGEKILIITKDEWGMAFNKKQLRDKYYIIIVYVSKDTVPIDVLFKNQHDKVDIIKLFNPELVAKGFIIKFQSEEYNKFELLVQISEVQNLLKQYHRRFEYYQ